MAQFAAVKSLTADLVNALSGHSKDHDASTIEDAERRALQIFSQSHSARTNQFEVEARFAGLEEKFRILNRDEIADALRIRLDELSACSTPWTPEMLALFLSLSDRPVEKSRVEDLEDIGPEPQPTTLTWSEILADDPLDNKDGLWENIDYTVGDSSDDEYIESNFRSSRAASPEASPDSSVEEQDTSINLEALTVLNEHARLDEILKAQFWKESELQGCLPTKRSVTEAQVFRDVLFMLHGLPTSTFVQIEDGRYIFARQIHVDHMSEDSLIQILGNFATLGSQFSMMGVWIRRDETVPLLQSCQAAFASRVRGFNQVLSKIEATATLDSLPPMKSLLDLSKNIAQESRPVQQLAEIIGQLLPKKQGQGPFILLEMLYEKTCTNQLCGDVEGYKYMGELFLECFRTYLSSIQQWMERGDLAKSNEIFFISEQHHAVPLDSLWAEQYSLVKTEAGDLYAPKFLHLAAKKIFNAGKSVNFLKALGLDAGGDTATPQVLSSLKLDIIDFGATPATLNGFAEVFELALDQWISQHSHSASSILRQQLKSRCRLQETLDALEYMFFQRDGARSSNFLYAMFAKIDQGRGSWEDDSVLTELFREALEPLLGFAVQRLTIRSASGRQKTRSKTRSVRILEDLQVCFSLPWALSNIFRPESILTYQRIYIMLVQTQRARHTLVQQRLEARDLPRAHSSHGELYLAQSLRHRLLWLINCVLTYLTELAIERSTKTMREDLAKTEGMDEIIAIHREYISRLEEQCLLSKKLDPIHQALISIFDLAMSFADAHAVYARQAPARRTHRSPSSSEDSQDEEARDDGQSNNISTDTTYLFRLKKMHLTFTNLHSFMLAGLQGVHRAGADPKVEALADLLAVDLKKQNRLNYQNG